MRNFYAVIFFFFLYIILLLLLFFFFTSMRIRPGSCENFGVTSTCFLPPLFIILSILFARSFGGWPLSSLSCSYSYTISSYAFINYFLLTLHIIDQISNNNNKNEIYSPQMFPSILFQHCIDIIFQKKKDKKRIFNDTECE